LDEKDYNGLVYVDDGPWSICRICGRRIWAVGNGTYGARSHARKHVREGKAVEVHVQSPRCYNGYDIVFFVKKGVRTIDEPERE